MLVATTTLLRWWSRWICGLCVCSAADQPLGRHLAAGRVPVVCGHGPRGGQMFARQLDRRPRYRLVRPSAPQEEEEGRGGEGGGRGNNRCFLSLITATFCCMFVVIFVPPDPTRPTQAVPQAPPSGWTLPSLLRSAPCSRAPAAAAAPAGRCVWP